MIGRALRQGLWHLQTSNIRHHATDKHRTVDDTPYGGGAGMVMRADVVAEAIRAARLAQPNSRVIFLGPAGKRWVQADAQRLATEGAAGKGLIVLCGHYEGVDERVLEAEVDEVISLGDFVLTGGEAAAVCLVDAVVRLLPGVLGAEGSLHEESFDLIDPETGTLLVEYPHYTRPAVWEGRAVPEVLQQGNHAEICKWRLNQARERTAKALKNR